MNVIEKLKIKPKQENKTSFNYNLKKEAVKVIAKRRDTNAPKDSKSKIVEPKKIEIKQKGFFVDKTNVGFNRAEFMQQIKSKRKVRNIQPKRKRILEPQRIVSPTRNVFRFIKKIKRKVKLGVKKKAPRKPRKTKLHVNLLLVQKDLVTSLFLHIN